MVGKNRAALTARRRNLRCNLPDENDACFVANEDEATRKDP